MDNKNRKQEELYHLYKRGTKGKGKLKTIRDLAKHIKKMDFSPCCFKYCPKTEMWKGLIPLRWKIDAEILANEYDVDLIIKKGKETSYRFDEASPRDVIVITLGKDYEFNYRHFLKTIAHELAHKIQVDAGLIGYSDFLERWMYERIAERLAYYVCKAHFPKFKWHHSEFSTYRSTDDIEFLADMHFNQEGYRR